MAITFDLTSNAVVNDGQTASFEVSNIQGVPVSGCPIGKTFYKGGVGSDKLYAVDWQYSGTTVENADNSITFSGMADDTAKDKASLGYNFEQSGGAKVSLKWYGGADGAYYSTYVHIGLFGSDRFRVDYSNNKVAITMSGADTPHSGENYRSITNGTLFELDITYNGQPISGKINIDYVLRVGGVTVFSGNNNIIYVAEINSSITFEAKSTQAMDRSVYYVDIVSTSGLPNNCTGEVADATIEYYRNGVLDYTGNPLSFTADGSMDGDSIVARVSDGVDFTDSDPVIMSVLHYTSQPPSPQNITEGDPLSLTWDISGVTGEAVSGCPIGNSKYYQGINGYALSDTDFFGTPAGVITNPDGSATLSGSGNHRVLTPELWGDTANGIKQIVEKFKWRSGVTNVSSGAGVFSNQDGNLSAGLYVNNGEVYLLGIGIDTGYQASLYDTDVYFTLTSTYNGAGGLSTILEIVSDKGYSDSISTSTTVSPTAEPSLSTVKGIASSTGTADAVYILSEKEGTAGYFPDVCTGLSYQTDYTVNKNGVTVDSGSTTDTTISYSIPSVALGDAGNYDLTITNGGRDPFQSDTVVVSVNGGVIPVEPLCLGGEIRYLLELSRKIEWEPSLSTVTSLGSDFGIVSKFSVVQGLQSNYWTGWGGSYDVPSVLDLEVFLSQFLQKVVSLEAVLLTSFSFYADPVTSTVYLNTPLYVWQYFRESGSVSEVFGFSTTVKDPRDPSNDEYSGVRYPSLLRIPRIPVSDLPDPINGVVVGRAFDVSLINNDGRFDRVDFRQLFNSPVRVKKSIKALPEVSDFDTVSYGLIDDQNVSDTEYKIRIGELFRMLDEPVNDVISELDYPDAGDSIGKNLPVAWGFIRNAPLIKIDADGFQYLVADPEYLRGVNPIETVYDNDGNSIGFTEENGVITVTNDKAKSCDFYGREDNRIGDIVISEVSVKSGIAYVEGGWDIVETEKYRSTSPRISMFVQSGTVKSLVEKCLKNDTAFFMTKNDGRATLRKWAQKYDVWSFESWGITQYRGKKFTDSKYFCSSVKVGYDYDWGEKKSLKEILKNDQENEVIDIYNKKQRLSYETQLINESDAVNLSNALFNRQSERREIVTVAISGNTSKINRFDTVVAKIATGDPERLRSENLQWIVRYVDPAQDVLLLEAGVVDRKYESGLLSHVSNENESGLLSHVSNENESGLLSHIGSI